MFCEKICFAICIVFRARSAPASIQRKLRLRSAYAKCFSPFFNEIKNEEAQNVCTSSRQLLKQNKNCIRKRRTPYAENVLIKILNEMGESAQLALDSAENKKCEKLFANRAAEGLWVSEWVGQNAREHLNNYIYGVLLTQFCSVPPPLPPFCTPYACRRIIQASDAYAAAFAIQFFGRALFNYKLFCNAIMYAQRPTSNDRWYRCAFRAARQTSNNH